MRTFGFECCSPGEDNGDDIICYTWNLCFVMINMSNVGINDCVDGFRYKSVETIEVSEYI